MTLPELDRGRIAAATVPIAVDSWFADDLHSQASDIACRTIDTLSEPVAVHSLPLRPPRVRVFSYCFAGSLAGKAAEDSSAIRSKPIGHPEHGRAAGNALLRLARNLPTGSTRLKPPRDIIKLSDRLYYLLQPTLETLVATTDLSFPYPPFPYQLAGIAFLIPRFSALLADEMGLGKTMQAITSIRLLLCAGEIARVLLICPKPLVSNWQREFELWAPEIPVMAISGSPAQRQWQWEHTGTPLKIANYESVVRDQDMLTASRPPYDLVVLDEAQRIKNRNSATSEAVRAIPRARNWAMTGTPIENSREDLIGIFDFLAPGYLQPEMTAKRLGCASKDYILRRTKDMVLDDLPPKMYRDARLDLTPAQRETYELAENEGVVRLSKLGRELQVQHVFELVLRLKQICNFDPATGESSKFERLWADLDEVAASGEKAIVFSQWVDTIHQLRDRLAAFHPYEYHGRVPARQREGVIEAFRSDPRSHVILMSYGAGSVGLNLQFCRYVFLFDRWWNPAVEDQAINRAHRIGAAGSVTISRFVSVKTIEERIDEILNQKRDLFESIISTSQEKQNLGLSKDELFSLFGFSGGSSSHRSVA